jgi:hypothetical protein
VAHPIYHLDLQVTRCSVELRLNDFPVAELTSPDEQPASFAPPINPYLVGDLNIVDVTILPLVAPDGTTSSFWDARVEGWVRRYEKGDIVAPGEGPAVTSFGIPDDLAERVREEELELPQSFTHVFSNDVLDFSPELGDAAPFDDRDALVDYALHLRDLTGAADVDALMQELEPKIQTWVAAYDEPHQAFADSLRQELSEFMTESPIVDFERDQVEVSPCCGGRIWRLTRGGEPLLQSDVLPDGSRTQFQVFVAPRDGALRIVR